MVIGCGTVSFRSHPLELALKSIADAGYEYVEPQATGPWCPHIDVDRDDPARYARLVSDMGFKGTTALWASHGAIISDDLSVEYGIRCIEWAAAAGIPVVNMGDGFKPDDMSEERAWEVLRARLLTILETAESSRVVVAIEPHGTFSLTASGLSAIMSISQSEYLGVNYDAANVRRAAYVETKDGGYTWKQADGASDEVTTLSAVAGRVKHYHAKDVVGRECVALGTGEVDNRGCIELLRNAGYTGALSVETEGDCTLDEARALISAARTYLLGLVGAW